MTRSQLNMIQNKNPQISNHVRKTLNSRLDTSLEDGQRDLSTPYWSILRHKNTPDVFKSIVERIMRSDQDPSINSLIVCGCLLALSSFSRFCN
jgi:hypothetical protein